MNQATPQAAGFTALGLTDDHVLACTQSAADEGRKAFAGTRLEAIFDTVVDNDQYGRALIHAYCEDHNVTTPVGRDAVDAFTDSDPAELTAHVRAATRRVSYLSGGRVPTVTGAMLDHALTLIRSALAQALPDREPDDPFDHDAARADPPALVH